MERDMEIVRRIALDAAAMPWGSNLTELEGVDPAAFGMHVIWMIEAGLVVGKVFIKGGKTPPNAWVERLTWEGCEFASAVRNDTLWRKAREKVLQPTASFTFGLLKDWLAKEISNGLPTLGR